MFSSKILLVALLLRPPVIMNFFLIEVRSHIYNILDEPLILRGDPLNLVFTYQFPFSIQLLLGLNTEHAALLEWILSIVSIIVTREYISVYVEQLLIRCVVASRSFYAISQSLVRL